MMTALLKSQVTAASAKNQAYYVQYETGKKLAAINEIKAMGGVIDYDLARWQLLAVSVPAANTTKLKTAPALLNIEPVPSYELTGEEYPFGLDMVQALDVWDFDRDGALDSGAPSGSGIKVCIIDTGVFDAHKDLAATTISGVSQIVGEAWNETVDGHGTHVVGTVAANVQGLGLAGVAPETEIFVVKIFNNESRWVGGQSNLGAAAESCAENGADIISISLKGEESAQEKIIFDSLFENDGILTIAAAGNDGSSSGTIDELSFPASYDSVISVGAVTSSYTHASYSNENNQLELVAPGSAVMSTWPTPQDGSIPHGMVVDDEGVHVGMYVEESTPGTQSGLLIDGNLCREEDMSDDWDGKIVLCRRQALRFRDMVDHAEQKGAIATIIIWLEPGLMVGSLAPSTSIGPVVMVSKETGDFLQSNKLDTVVTVETEDGSDPLTGAGGYRGLRGTSMAAPHVAGVAALIWSVCPELSNVELRSLLAKTALDLGDLGRDASFGFGLVQAFDAWHHCQPADLGDAPRSYGLVRHTGSGQLRLGNLWEVNSWQGDYPGAGLDDRNDDGLSFSEFVAGQTASVFVQAKGFAGNPWVNGWMDFNRNGVYEDDEEVVDNSVGLNVFTQFTFSVPPTVDVSKPINYRFRLYDKVVNVSTANTLSLTALPATINSGEVEDGITANLPTAVTLQSIMAVNAKDSGIVFALLFFSGLLLLTIFWSVHRKSHSFNLD